MAASPPRLAKTGCPELANSWDTLLAASICFRLVLSQSRFTQSFTEVLSGTAGGGGSASGLASIVVH